MSGVIEEISTGDHTSERHDEALQNLLAQHGDDPAQFLATVFGFLQRQTSYLNQTDAQRRVTAALRKVTGAQDIAGSGVKSGFFGAPKPVGTELLAPCLIIWTTTDKLPAALVCDQHCHGDVSWTMHAMLGSSRCRPQPYLLSQAASKSTPPAAPAASAAAAVPSAPDAGPADATAPAAPAAAAPAPDAGAGPSDEAKPMEEDTSTGLSACCLSTLRSASFCEFSDDLWSELSVTQPCWCWCPAEPNVGNGSDHDTYSWTQTLGDVSLNVPVPPGTKGRGCDVSITRNRLKVSKPDNVWTSWMLLARAANSHLDQFSRGAPARLLTLVDTVPI